MARLPGVAAKLHWSGRIPVDLSEAVIAPVQLRLERPRRALAWEDVQRLLKAVDRSTPMGLRDYALLLMMSTYDLGAGEAIRLRFEDIDWEADALSVVPPRTRGPRSRTRPTAMMRAGSRR
ncbi:hypothetical protein ACWGS9_28615 [Bradyrhizobium sp. Arg314]